MDLDEITDIHTPLNPCAPEFVSKNESRLSTRPSLASQKQQATEWPNREFFSQAAEIQEIKALNEQKEIEWSNREMLSRAIMIRKLIAEKATESKIRKAIRRQAKRFKRYREEQAEDLPPTSWWELETPDLTDQESQSRDEEEVSESSSAPRDFNMREILAETLEPELWPWELAERDVEYQTRQAIDVEAILNWLSSLTVDEIPATVDPSQLSRKRSRESTNNGVEERSKRRTEDS